MKSEFVCTRKEFFLQSLKWYFLMLLSGFLLFPLAYYYRIRYVIEHTRISDKELCFSGKISECYTLFIKSFFLVILTIGIYYFFLKGKFIRWEIEHTHFKDNSEFKTSSFNYKLKDYFISSINGIILTILTLGVAFPQYQVMKYRIKENNRTIDEEQTMFVGKVKGAYFVLLFNAFMTVITLGIFRLMKDYETRKYHIVNTVLKSDCSKNIEETLNWIERFNERSIFNYKTTFFVYSVILVVLVLLATVLILKLL